MTRTLALLGFAAVALGASAGPTPAQAPALHLIVKKTPLVSEGDVLGDRMTVSPDCRHVAYREARGARQVVTRDGRPGKEYDSIEPASLVFSPDSQHLGYIATSAGKMVRVLDGKEGPAYEKVTSLIFSPNSRRTAYLAHREGSGPRVVVDGDEGRSYEMILLDSLTFSPDSRQVAYMARRGSRASGGPMPPDLSPETARLWGGWRTVVAGKEGKTVDLFLLLGSGVPTLVFSPDSRRLAYSIYRGDKQHVVIDG